VRHPLRHGTDSDLDHPLTNRWFARLFGSRATQGAPGILCIRIVVPPNGLAALEPPQGQGWLHKIKYDGYLHHAAEATPRSVSESDTADATTLGE
jgi:hypothetical protein